MIKTWWKGVRGLLASVKELFTPERDGISTGKDGADRSVCEDSFIHGKRKTAV